MPSGKRRERFRNFGADRPTFFMPVRDSGDGDVVFHRAAFDGVLDHMSSRPDPNRDFRAALVRREGLDGYESAPRQIAGVPSAVGDADLGTDD